MVTSLMSPALLQNPLKMWFATNENPSYFSNLVCADTGLKQMILEPDKSKLSLFLCDRISRFINDACYVSRNFLYFLAYLALYSHLTPLYF